MFTCVLERRPIVFPEKNCVDGSIVDFLNLIASIYFQHGARLVVNLEHRPSLDKIGKSSGFYVLSVLGDP